VFPGEASARVRSRGRGLPLGVSGHAGSVGRRTRPAGRRGPGPALARVGHGTRGADRHGARCVAQAASRRGGGAARGQDRSGSRRTAPGQPGASATAGTDGGGRAGARDRALRHLRAGSGGLQGRERGGPDPVRRVLPRPRRGGGRSRGARGRPAVRREGSGRPAALGGAARPPVSARVAPRLALQGGGAFARQDHPARRLQRPL
jgi:hypothetical protein